MGSTGFDAVTERGVSSEEDPESLRREGTGGVLLVGTLIAGLDGGFATGSGEGIDGAIGTFTGGAFVAEPEGAVSAVAESAVATVFGVS